MTNDKLALLKIAMIDAEFFLDQLEILAETQNPDDLELDDAILKARANAAALQIIVAANRI